MRRYCTISIFIMALIQFLNAQKAHISGKIEVSSDAEGNAGKTADWAIDRAIGFGWNEILTGIETGDEKRFGVGLHAIQDIFAHKGATNNKHLGINLSSARLFLNDVQIGDINDQRKAYKATLGIMTLYGVLTGNQKVIDSMKNADGNVVIQLQDITNDNVRSQIY